MSDQSKTAQERADRTPDDNVEAAVEGTFPASDPMGTIASEGARAVPPEELMRGRESKPPADAATIAAEFDSAEAAKLALETLVRDGPVDRSRAEIERGEGAASVRVSVPRADEQRLGDMLRRQPGRTG